MSNQASGSWGSAPFVTDNEYKSLSLAQLNYILNEKKKEIKKNYKQLSEKEKIIRDIRKLDKLNEKIIKGVDIKKEYKEKKKKIKSFDEYFNQCIKNKKIPKDTPVYLREALERAMREYDQGLVKEKSSLSDFANKYTIEGVFGFKPAEFFEHINNILVDFLTYHRNIKFKLTLVCMMEKTEIEKGKGILDIKEDKAYFNSPTLNNLESDDVQRLIDISRENILGQMEVYAERGSNWVFKEVVKLEIHTVEYNPNKGSSYIDLPSWIKNKKAIVNIKNKDDKCFLWCILRYLHPKESHEERIKDLEKYEYSLNTKGITFPMKVNNISQFEKLNPELPGINVFSNDDKMIIYPLREAKRDCKNTIDLFLYEEDGATHYTLIKNFNRLIRYQKTTSHNGEIFICKRCFSHYTKEELLEKHIKYCSKNQTAPVKMPEPNTMLYFKNYHKQLPIPFVVYADFECFTKPMNSCCPNPKDSYNYNYQKHEPSGFCFYVKGIVDKKIKPITYTKTSEDEDISKIFVEKLAEVTKGIYNNFYQKPKPLRLTRAEQKSFEKAVNCYICGGELKKDKVRDHCHFTGQYRGAAHNKCNLMCKKPRVLPVIFHNLQGYDAHLFIKQLARLEGDLSCIPSTEEKYISFSKNIKVGEYYSNKLHKMMDINFEIRFLDSYKFLQTSLANLVSNLSEDDFHNTKHVFKTNIELLTRKGVYPYDYVSSLDKLSESQLPPKEEFYSHLNDEDISDEDYQHAIKVWNIFRCKTIRDYHNLYQMSDVLLLADVFENFRKTCLKHYNLDPLHYYTSPGLAWDACLKTTGQKLELLHNYDMLMFEQGIRGGITHVSKRYAEANNKYMKDYNPGKESTFIQYLDANNLYGWAMTQQLPTHGFKWMKDITLEKVDEILEKVNHSMFNKGKKGYIFEVDLEYPPHLWEIHNDYPLAPEKMIVNGVEKLISHFKPRKNYVVHYRALRQCLELGMRITAVHRGISFYQSPWMEPYIRKNTELRMCAANNFEKDFFKLMNNSVFGKTIENIRKRQNIHLIDNRKKAVKLSSKPNFDRCTIFDKNLIAIHMLKTEVYFNKPVYVGQAILDLSKTLMFNFHYTYIKEKYRNKAELLFTDTDSLMYQIKTKDFYLDICPDVRGKFDTSDYPDDHPSGIITGANKKVIGMFKDEVAGKQITHFVGLRPKLYSFKIEEDREVRKCKGVKKSVVKKKLDFEDYVKCLFSGEKEMRSMKIIRSEKHDIYSKEVNKIALSNEDDKRIVLDDKIHTLAFR